MRDPVGFALETAVLTCFILALLFVVLAAGQTLFGQEVPGKIHALKSGCVGRLEAIQGQDTLWYSVRCTGGATLGWLDQPPRV